MATKSEVDLLREQLEKLSLEMGKVKEEKPQTHSPSFLLMPAQKKIKSFSGRDQEFTVEDFLYDIQAAISVRSLSDEDKTHFIFQHLEGPAREEVKLRPFSERKTVSQICQILQETFGVKSTGVHLQRLFFECRQKEGDNLREYSHKLMEALNKAIGKCSYLKHSQDRLLCEQFAEGVRDPILKRHLKKELRDHLDISFLRLRKEAVDWAEEDDSREAKEKVSVHVAQVARPSVSQELSEMKQLLKDQQHQILMQQQQIDHVLKLATNHPPVAPAPPKETTLKVVQ